ncbi:hypothetical protein [Herbiconiux sp.]|uniref:hypothetical protein n=1 Tax=Herbiconiux sp. TaxID=1871186 RepID=UPI0025C5AB44|nr:hypothetical protein [Herbiconiux sp.]
MVSFVELWESGVVVRMVGLAEGFVRRVLQLEFELLDDQGARYPFRAATSGGMVLPEEVTIAFEGAPKLANCSHVDVLVAEDRLRLLMSAVAA